MSYPHFARLSKQMQRVSPSMQSTFMQSTQRCVLVRTCASACR
jgi:hypothetical protein